MKDELFIGLMSGTSLDGVDVALVKLNSDNPQLHVLHTYFLPYPSSLRSQIILLQHPLDNELEITALISNQLAYLYAKAVNQLLQISNIGANEIIAIGCHGQTIRHQPGFKDGIGFSLQIGNAALLSELTNITVVSDFRSRDIAAGGQGAPLVPAFHQALFSSNCMNRAIINIGGIANITYLERTGTKGNSKMLGFDSGPGNMLLDGWIKLHKNLNYDNKGDWASSGNLIKVLLSEMLMDPYFFLKPPKSTGRDLFNMKWLEKFLLNKNYRSEDVARTLVALTAKSIVNMLSEYCAGVEEVYICGGGAHNTLLIDCIQTSLSNIKIEKTDVLGIEVDWVEAIAFAWLANQCLKSRTSNLPEVTGAKGARILGAIYRH